MSGASLFPDDYPAVPIKERPPTPCCVDLAVPSGVPPHTWTFLHTLCHSRIPFTLAGFMAVTCAPEREATTAIAEAKRREWVQPVWPEPYMTDPIEQWVGNLPRRR